jgi:soluble lytic murein transglycosylase
MPRERRAFAAIGRLAIIFIVGFGQVLPGQAATEDGLAAGRPELSSFEQAPPHLGARDVELYREIFSVQERGEWGRADRLIARLEDRVLLGHVLYQRYMHPTGYRSQFAELSAWLDAYADHPDADRVHRLASRRRPGGAPAPQAPVRGYLGGAGQELQERAEVRYRDDVARTPGGQMLVDECATR